MPGWDTFAVVIGGTGGALVGLLFVAISIHAAKLGSSADLRNRAAQTLVVFATLLLASVILAVPSQPDRLVGVEFVVLAVVVAVGMVLLERRAGKGSTENMLSRVLERINPNYTTALGALLTGGLMIGGVSWAPYVLFPTACIAIVGGLASAYLLLTTLSD
jgi:multisubunit Na+/H+ antiporter MnhF subunit